MSKKSIFLLLPFLSIIIFLFVFGYIISGKINAENTNPYYKTSSTSHNDPTLVTHTYVWSGKNYNHAEKLLSKKKITQEFRAGTNHLGIIAVAFDTGNRSIDDTIVFRLKQKYQKGWYYQGTYEANQMQQAIPFPFGFPLINQSKNKMYVFEIESLRGTDKNFLSLNKTTNVFLPKYKFSKAELLKNPRDLVEFLMAKVREEIAFLNVYDDVLLLLSLILPFVTYFFIMSRKHHQKIAIQFYDRCISWLKLFLIKLSKNNKILAPLERREKIFLCVFIICIGFFCSVAYHYYQMRFNGQGYPLNSFLPVGGFGDYALMADQWEKYHFNGIGYGLSYFPATYLLVEAFVRLFKGPHIIDIYLLCFAFFFLWYAYTNLKTNNKLESIYHTFVIVAMSYPFLFSIQTANVEMYTFTFVCLYFLFYRKHRILADIFLGYAISMKFFPAIFLVNYLFDKRYKDLVITIGFVLLFTLIPLVIFDGGFNKGIGNYISHLRASQNMYVELMIMSGAGNHYGHSLINGARALMPQFFPSMKPILFPYEVCIAFVSIGLIAYLLFIEKVFWKRIAVLVVMMNLFPFTSTDYKLLYVFLPLFFFINYHERESSDTLFVILFSLLLIPKDYMYFNNWQLATLNVVGNPIIMLVILSYIFYTTYSCKFQAK